MLIVGKDREAPLIIYDAWPNLSVSHVSVIYISILNSFQADKISTRKDTLRHPQNSGSCLPPNSCSKPEDPMVLKNTGE